MSSINVALDTLDAAVAAIGELDYTGCDPVERLRVLERLETSGRRQAVVTHDIIAGLANADPVGLT